MFLVKQAIVTGLSVARIKEILDIDGLGSFTLVKILEVIKSFEKLHYTYFDSHQHHLNHLIDAVILQKTTRHI